MIVYIRSQNGAFGINLRNIIDFSYDHKSRKLSITLPSGKSYTSMDEDFIKTFFSAITKLERQEKAVSAKVERPSSGLE